MSRAFVKEDPEEVPSRYELPPRTDPGYDAAAAWVLLEGANQGDTLGAEAATGYRWGEPVLRAHIEQLQVYFRQRGDDRMETLAQRFLRA